MGKSWWGQALEGLGQQQSGPTPVPEPQPAPKPEPTPSTENVNLRLSGTVPPEIWNRLGTKILPKLRKGDDLNVGVESSVSIDPQLAPSIEAELKQILSDLGLSTRIKVERL